MNMKVFCTKSYLCVTLLTTLLIIVGACRQKSQPVVLTQASNSNQEEKFDPYVEGNKRILSLESEEIELVIKRHHWNMEKTGTGLFVEILEPGSGSYFVEGDSVVLDYTVSLLSGEEIYNSKNDGKKTFRVDKSEEIPALHEAVKMMRPGAEARLVIPSHLAYGAGGDGNKIVGREALVMWVRAER